jgi:hypothetical protein
LLSKLVGLKMSLNRFLVVALLASVALAGVNLGSISITENDQQKTVWLHGGGNVSTNGNSFTMNGGARVYIADYASDTYDPNAFKNIPMLGKYI